MSDPNEHSGVFMPSLAASDADADSGANESGASLIGVGADLPTGSTAKQRVSNGTLVLLLTVVVAGGVLTMMRKYGLGTGLKLVDVRIDYPMDGPKPAEIAEHRKVIDALRTSAVAVQVPLTGVKKNPFTLALEQPAAAPTPGPARPAVNQAELERQRRAQLIQTTFESLKLNSVLAGSIPVARINGENVREGDILKGVFTVTAIRGRSVDLVADGEVYTLTMGGR